MKKTALLLLFALIASMSYGQEMGYKFRLTLKDKGKTSYSIKKPEKFLSQKALDRRAKQGIKVDETDLPISEKYIERIEKTGAIVVAKSKWQSTVSIHTEDSVLVETLKKLPFVQDAKLVWRSNNKEQTPKGKAGETKAQMPKDIAKPQQYYDYYGYAADNIRTVNGQYLHDAGFKGQGMLVGVIDAGFNNYPLLKALDNVKVVDKKNFVYEDAKYDDMADFQIHENASSHGLNVLSTMATNKPYYFVGTAPQADYVLLATEDVAAEFPIEEDYWTVALEYADSIGVDIINSSLGYSKFDDPIGEMNKEDLTGEVAFISRTANLASRKGIFVTTSAGNSGTSDWKKLTPPGDAKGVLTVAAMKKDSTMAEFSSWGYTADLRIKPDIAALGFSSAVIDDTGYEAKKNGTSFSTPIMCGLVTCLWQAFPSLTNLELIKVIQQSADKYDEPNPHSGHGIPDMKLAMEIAEKLVNSKIK